MGQSISFFPNQPRVLWRQVWGLAAIQAAITLAWLIYGAYLPKLLTELGLPEGLGLKLLIVESALAVMMEPLMGGLSDQSYRWVGSRFPFIAIGVIFSSALFILIPAVVIFGSPVEVFQWLLIGVLVVWSLAMTVFRSPAIALLGKYATPNDLPIAASLLTLFGGLVGAFRPVSNQFLLNNLPPMFIFALGSFILLGAGAVLRAVQIPETPNLSDRPTSLDQSVFLSLIFISTTGTLVGWGIRFLMYVLGNLVNGQMGAERGSLIMVLIGLVLAVLALPAGKLASHFGNRNTLIFSLGAASLGLLGMGVLPNFLWLLALVIIPAFSVILNSVIPWILSLVPSDRTGLGIGSYFGGFSAAMALVGLIFPDFSVITPMMGSIYGAVAFIGGAMCVKFAFSDS